MDRISTVYISINILAIIKFISDLFNKQKSILRPIIIKNVIETIFQFILHKAKMVQSLYHIL